MQIPDPHLLVILGASGDLTGRKLIPSILSLERLKLLPGNFIILGTGRTAMDDNSFRRKMEEVLIEQSGIKNDDPVLSGFLNRLFYITIDTGNPAEYQKLSEFTMDLNKRYDTKSNMIFYLATPPSLYTTIIRNLGQEKLNREDYGWRRIIIEKPFGYDLASSHELNRELLAFFNEEQVYRIDHYLGKETVQNIMVTRFSNSIFEPLWNRNYIHHVEITSAEFIGIESRGGYYDRSGALRDMLQNHLLQLVALVAMEPPVFADSSSVRNEMVKVFQSFRPLSNDNLEHAVIRGQYIKSVIRGEKVPGYRQEKGVDKSSRTETYVAVKFFIDNWRWKDVPFYVRTGKRLPTRVTEIVIHFHPTPHHIFCWDTSLNNSYNQLIIRIQPDEGLLLKFGMKVPGAGYKVQPVNMDFHYSSLSEVYLPTAYERLLLDCMLGDLTLYARGDAVEAAWKFVDPILAFWSANKAYALYGYPAGTWGPREADELFPEKWVTWRYPCKNLAQDGIYCEL